MNKTSTLKTTTYFSIPKVMRRHYWTMMKRHPGITFFLILLSVNCVIAAFMQGRFVQALTYYGAVSLSIIAIDATLSVNNDNDIQIRYPRTEIILLIITYSLAMLWLMSRFVLHYAPRSIISRLLFLGFGLGSVFSITTALFQVILNYRPAELGARLRGFTSVPLVILCFAALTLGCSPSTLTFVKAYHQAGTSCGLLLLALASALPEEFFRFLWQTRIATISHRRALGWLIASLLWALLHLPKELAASNSLLISLNAVANIVPIGLLWGYVTLRSRSFLPSLVLHATNFWGLQNLS